jgi:transcriptional regulator with XRE-family HTH domain
MNVQAKLKELRQGAEYWSEVLVHEFTDALDAARRTREVTRSEMADRMGVNKAYVTKLFNGNANFTVLTMVKAARVLGLRVHIHIAPEDVEVQWMEQVPGTPAPRSPSGERAELPSPPHRDRLESVRDEPEDGR